MMKKKKKFSSLIEKLPIKKKSSLNFNKRRSRKNNSNYRFYSVFAGQVAGCILLAFLIAYTFFCGFVVSGISMEPTLEAGNRIFINRLGRIVSPKSGDIIAFETHSGGNKIVNIKRVVAIPGDTVYISNGQLYVNGKKEDFDQQIEDQEPMEEAGMAKNEITLQKGEFFILGDNRNYSEDSRYETIGTIKKKDIMGVVWMCYSVNNFGLVG